MFCMMDPPIEESISTLSDGRWLLGSSMICEIISDIPDGAMKTWDGDGSNVYCLRRISEKQGDFSTVRVSASSYRVHHAGTSSAVWKLGDVFVKVKSWRAGMQLESDTIDYVRTVSSVPVPDVIYSWIDAELHRSFLVLRDLKGQTLYETWPRLSHDQREELALEVARHCNDLAKNTSMRLETAHEKGVVEPFLAPRCSDSEPSWKPQPFGPISIKQLTKYIPKPNEVLGSQGVFYFCHVDLGPRNIIIDREANLVGILDWESAGFYPRFWLATKPLISAGFFVDTPGEGKREWGVLLTEALSKKDLVPDQEKYLKWKNAMSIG